MEINIRLIKKKLRKLELKLIFSMLVCIIFSCNSKSIKEDKENYCENSKHVEFVYDECFNCHPYRKSEVNNLEDVVSFIRKPDNEFKKELDRFRNDDEDLHNEILSKLSNRDFECVVKYLLEIDSVKAR